MKAVAHSIEQPLLWMVVATRFQEKSRACVKMMAFSAKAVTARVFFSSTVTWRPRRARWIAAVIPPIPAPRTITDFGFIVYLTYARRLAETEFPLLAH